ncbi:MAG: hypothetical protein ACI9O6_000518 [Glaciecola sp.]|jgi:hypothetical protein
MLYKTFFEGKLDNYGLVGIFNTLASRQSPLLGTE